MISICFQFTFNWFQFTFNLLSIDFNLLSTDFNLLSIDFNLLLIDFNLLSIEINLLLIDFNLLLNDFNLLAIYFQLISIYFWLISIYFQFTFKGFVFFSTPKVAWHNRVPSKHSYYWVTQPLMGYPLKKLFGCCFFNKGLIRHLIIWKTLHFKALSHIWLSKVNGPALLKERWRRLLFFFQPQKLLGTIEYHPNIHIIE